MPAPKFPDRIVRGGAHALPSARVAETLVRQGETRTNSRRPIDSLRAHGAEDRLARCRMSDGTAPPDGPAKNTTGLMRASVTWARSNCLGLILRPYLGIARMCAPKSDMNLVD